MHCSILCMLYVMGTSIGSAEDAVKNSKPGKIVNGISTSADNYPWIASIRVSGVDLTLSGYGDQEWHFCGGSLIHSDPATILTAAHCVADLTSDLEYYASTYGGTWGVVVDVGRDDADDTTETTFERLTATHWTAHASYDSSSMRNDMALMVLDGAITGATPVELYTEPIDFTTNTNMRVVGYGADYSGGDPTPTLEYADTQFVDLDTCNKYFIAFYNFADDITDWDNPDFSVIPNYALSWNYVYDGMLCTTDDESDSCQGDSGGPLLHGTDMNDPQSGIVSWGYGCANVTPGVYADVGYYYDWIDTKVTNLGLDLSPVATEPSSSPTDDPSQPPTEPSSSPTDSPTYDGETYAPTPSPINGLTPAPTDPPGTTDSYDAAHNHFQSIVIVSALMACLIAVLF